MVQGADVAKFYSTLGTHFSHSSTLLFPPCLAVQSEIIVFARKECSNWKLLLVANKFIILKNAKIIGKVKNEGENKRRHLTFPPLLENFKFREFLINLRGFTSYQKLKRHFHFLPYGLWAISFFLLSIILKKTGKKRLWCQQLRAKARKMRSL